MDSRAFCEEDKRSIHPPSSFLIHNENNLKYGHSNTPYNSDITNPIRYHSTKSTRKVSKYVQNELSPFQFFANKRSSTRVRDIGTMLSGLSKSNKKREEQIKAESENKRQNSRFNRRKKDLQQGRLNDIESMRNVYMQQKTSRLQLTDKTTSNLLPRNVLKSTNGELQNYNKQRHIHPSLGVSVDSNENSLGKESNEDDSMRELIDWLESVDLNGIEDF